VLLLLLLLQLLLLLLLLKTGERTSGGASTKETLRMNCRANICGSGSTHLGEWLDDVMLSCWQLWSTYLHYGFVVSP
jgi:succinate dehydrogenase/fumarate reductase-like Fe-S protein